MLTSLTLAGRRIRLCEPLWIASVACVPHAHLTRSKPSSSRLPSSSLRSKPLPRCGPVSSRAMANSWCYLGLLGNDQSLLDWVTFHWGWSRQNLTAPRPSSPSLPLKLSLAANPDDIRAIGFMSKPRCLPRPLCTARCRGHPQSRLAGHTPLRRGACAACVSSKGSVVRPPPIPFPVATGGTTRFLKAIWRFVRLSLASIVTVRAASDVAVRSVLDRYGQYKGLAAFYLITAYALGSLRAAWPGGALAHWQRRPHPGSESQRVRLGFTPGAQCGEPARASTERKRQTKVGSPTGYGCRYPERA